MSEKKKTDTIIFKVSIPLDKEKKAKHQQKNYSRIHSVAMAVHRFSYIANHVTDIEEGQTLISTNGFEVSWMQGEDRPRTDEQMINELFSYVRQGSYGVRSDMINVLSMIHNEVSQKILQLPPTGLEEDE